MMAAQLVAPTAVTMAHLKVVHLAVLTEQQMALRKAEKSAAVMAARWGHP